MHTATFKVLRIFSGGSVWLAVSPPPIADNLIFLFLRDKPPSEVEFFYQGKVIFCLRPDSNGPRPEGRALIFCLLYHTVNQVSSAVPRQQEGVQLSFFE